MIRHCFCLIIVLILTGSTDAAIRIDYGTVTGVGIQSVQPGFTGVEVPVNPGVSSVLANFANPFGDGANIDVIASVPSGTDLRGRNRDDTDLVDGILSGGSILGTVTNTGIDSLVQDLIFNQGGGVITLTIQGIGPGSYLFTSYFNDSYFDGGFALAGHDFSMSVNGGTPVLATSSGVNNGSTDGIPTSVSTNFNVSAPGSVIITFTGTGSDKRLPLNGLEISLVPEPTSLAMLSLGGSGLWLCRRITS